MLEYEIDTFRDGNGVAIKHAATVQTSDEKFFSGEGPTEDSALLDAMAKAAAESSEARAELGILLGKRGGGTGGRPSGPNRETS